MRDISNMFREEGSRYTKTLDIFALMSKMNMSEEQAMDLLNVDPADRPLYSSYLNEIRKESAVTAPR